jgi:L-fuculose-phosphate aldolase
MTEDLQMTRAHIVDLGKRLYERFLTDSAGGNISARLGNLVCITPRFAGSNFHWDLRPEQVLVTDLQGNKIEGEGDLSREAKVHLKLYNDFPDGMAVVHCHARHVMVFVMAGLPIPPVLECSVKIGEVNVVQYAPAHSARLSEFVAAGFLGKEDCIQKFASGVIAPYHGLFVLGKDLDTAFDAAERINTNAYCIMMSKLLPGRELEISQHSRLVEETLANYHD